ncbi:MAG: RidA family protein [Nitrospina sp.]|jgi:2-iminobutanoate/2-iminopropanoate deaminase|nr:RidA family protein [Nitrospina sp.]
MEKKPIQTTQAPSAIGPYSQAIRIGDFLYTSGQIALKPDTMEMMNGEIEEETEWVLKHIEAILQAGGLSLAHVIKTTVYLTDLGDFSRMNQVYEKFFKETKPARACVQVAALPKGAKVEIDAIAAEHLRT